MQPVQEGPRRILSQEHIPDTREMLDKIRHQTLRENCKLPINILHKHTATIARKSSQFRPEIEKMQDILSNVESVQ